MRHLSLLLDVSSSDGDKLAKPHYIGFTPPPNRTIEHQGITCIALSDTPHFIALYAFIFSLNAYPNTLGSSYSVFITTFITIILSH